MQLVTSLTVDASLLRKLLALWDAGGDPRNPFKSVLVTPLFSSPATLRLIREELKDRRGATVYFDSGGYYAQQGKIAFDQLYCELRDYYRNPENQWADWYVLPDHVPVSTDSPEAVAEKVNDTVTAAKMFSAEMPPRIQESSIAVIQGHTMDQLNRCIEVYRKLALDYVGFGSFGTSGSNSSINKADARSVAGVQHVARELASQGMKLHTFGVSTPPLIYALKRLGVHSFDSLAWQRSAGYGKIYMPFMRAYNVSHRSTKNGALTKEEFELMRQFTGHHCPFCDDFYQLSQTRLYRSLHNLVAVMETVSPSANLSAQAVADLIAWKSQRYYKLFEEIYLGV